MNDEMARNMMERKESVVVVPWHGTKCRGYVVEFDAGLRVEVNIGGVMRRFPIALAYKEDSPGLRLKYPEPGSGPDVWASTCHDMETCREFARRHVARAEYARRDMEDRGRGVLEHPFPFLARQRKLDAAACAAVSMVARWEEYVTGGLSGDVPDMPHNPAEDIPLCGSGI
jgi:hypothetical protein